jgi:uncharacterized protein (DUF885 family)
MKVRVVFFATAMLLGACAPVLEQPEPPPPAPPPPTPDQQFEALAARYVRELPEQSPANATSLGDHRFDARLDDVSAAGWQSRIVFDELYLAALEPIDRKELSRANQLDALLLAHSLEYDRWRLQTLQSWRSDPLIYTRIAGGAINDLLVREFAPLPERLANIGARLDEMPRFLAQVREVLDPARVPKVHAETAARQNNGLISLLEGELTKQAETLPVEAREKLRASIAKARSALSQHQIWLDKRLTPEAKGEFRLGERLYDQKLALALFSPLTRQQIREQAEAELAATHLAMYGIARTVLKDPQLRKGRAAPPTPENPSAEQMRRAIRAALELAYAERPSRDGVLDAARAALVAATDFVRDRQLVTLPTEPLEIIEMPEINQGVALAYCDSPGPLDAGQKTFYAVSPIPAKWTRAQTDSFLREYNSRSIHDLTIHEAMPGHYLQLAHSNKYPRAGLRPIHRRLGRVRGESHGRRGLHERRSAHAAHPAQVVPAQHRQRVARPGGARRRHVARRRHETHDGVRLPGRTRSRGQMDARAADVRAAAGVLRRRARAPGAARRSRAAARSGVQSQGVSRQGAVVRVAAGAIRAATALRSADRMNGS